METNNHQIDTPKANYWRKSIKIGLCYFLVFLIGCFSYGWFNDFSFWHAFANAGLNAALAYTIYYGVFVGPVVFILATLVAKLKSSKIVN
jgi:hypothetical protein